LSISVAIYDPAMGGTDSFCMVTAIVTRENILLTDARFWNKKDFPHLTTRQIKDDIARINEHFKFDYHLCETNNMGHMVISDLRTDYHIPVIGITTSANLKTQKSLRSVRVLDKNLTVPWLVKFIEDGTIRFPKTLTKGLVKMKEETGNYGVSKSGKYEALSGHDDSISCLVILVHWAKRQMLKSKTLGLFGYGSSDPYDGKSSMEKSREHVMKRFENAGMNTDKYVLLLAMLDFDLFFQFTLNGFVIGAVYSILAIGFTFVFSTVKIIEIMA